MLSKIQILTFSQCWSTVAFAGGVGAGSPSVRNHFGCRGLRFELDAIVNAKVELHAGNLLMARVRHFPATSASLSA